VDKGLHLDLRVVNYTSNKETKEFIEREAARIERGFKRASGTRYLLNRWRETQLAMGEPIAYRDLVMQAIELNKTKHGPLRVEHGRYINFISDFMAANKNAPKTYESWSKGKGRSVRR
jgi:hypothetical protein